MRLQFGNLTTFTLPFVFLMTCTLASANFVTHTRWNDPNAYLLTGGAALLVLTVIVTLCLRHINRHGIYLVPVFEETPATRQDAGNFILLAMAISGMYFGYIKATASTATPYTYLMLAITAAILLTLLASIIEIRPKPKAG